VTIRYVRVGLRVVRVDTAAPVAPAEVVEPGEDPLVEAAFIGRVAAGLRADARRPRLTPRPTPRPQDARRTLTAGQLVRARRAAGLTQRQLAAELRYHRSLIAECERGQRTVPVDLGDWARGVLAREAAGAGG
jgi:DNA-binding transcriptional regulator YiaG